MACWRRNVSHVEKGLRSRNLNVVFKHAVQFLNLCYCQTTSIVIHVIGRLLFCIIMFTLYGSVARLVWLSLVVDLVLRITSIFVLKLRFNLFSISILNLNKIVVIRTVYLNTIIVSAAAASYLITCRLLLLLFYVLLLLFLPLLFLVSLHRLA